MEVSKETGDKDQVNKDFLRLKVKYQDRIRFL